MTRPRACRRLPLPPQTARFRPRLAVVEQRRPEEPRRPRADRLGLLAACAADAGAARVAREASATSRWRGSSTRTAIPITSAATPRSSRKYGCPIAVPAGEAPLVERWDEQGAALRLLRPARRALRRRPGPHARIDPRVGRPRMARARGAGPRHGRARVPSIPSTGSSSPGDALWEDGFGFVMPPEVDPARACRPRARRSRCSQRSTSAS